MQSFDWMPYDFVMILLPFVLFILKALQYSYKTSDINLGFRVGRLFKSVSSILVDTCSIPIGSMAAR